MGRLEGSRSPNDPDSDGGEGCLRDLARSSHVQRADAVQRQREQATVLSVGLYSQQHRGLRSKLQAYRGYGSNDRSNLPEQNALETAEGSLLKVDFRGDRQAPHSCVGMDMALSSVDTPLEYDDRFREFGVETRGGHAVDLISYCPWCGEKLPESLRDEWFECLRRLGLEPEDAGIPESMRTGDWWRNSR